jgi:hypothetical protein
MVVSYLVLRETLADQRRRLSDADTEGQPTPDLRYFNPAQR